MTWNIYTMNPIDYVGCKLKDPKGGITILRQDMNGDYVWEFENGDRAIVGDCMNTCFFLNDYEMVPV